ncbi:MAG: FkbM family methyltransferase [Candidatus Lokiarchaeota archaeon]|nr:FkbM family methyltransferase [Candidatus Lokiarchaeota archaeon]
MDFTSAKTERVLRNELLWEDAYGIRMLPEDSVDTVIDIGGNIGLYSLQARFRFPTARIIAFEPSPGVLEIFKKNTAGLDIEVYPIGLGEGKKAYLGESLKILAKSYTTNGTRKDISCDTLTLPDMFEKYKIDPERASLKIDCEGAEKYLVGDKTSENLLTACTHVGIETHFDYSMYRKWLWEIFTSRHLMNISRFGKHLIIAQFFSKKLYSHIYRHWLREKPKYVPKFKQENNT